MTVSWFLFNFSSVNRFLFFRSVLRYLLSALIGLPVLYVMLSLLLALVPYSGEKASISEGPVTIAIRTNGVHLEMVLPAVNSQVNWSEYLSVEATSWQRIQSHNISFAYGERDFYINTPEWSDLNLISGINAVMVNTPGAMHVAWLSRLPEQGNRTVHINLTYEKYEALAEYIKSSFLLSEEGHVQLIAGAGYGVNDDFYEATKAYNMIHTCNEWVNRALKVAGIRTATWSPFDQGVLYQLFSD